MFIRKNLIKNNLTKDNRDNDKGFTLAELLIVVAIIAVLVAISIPIFTSQLEKSREATDMANVRAAYAEVMDSVLDGRPVNASVREYNGEYSKVVNLKQRVNGWTAKGDKEIGGVKESDTNHWFGTPMALGTCKVIYSEAYGTRLIWENAISGGILADNTNWRGASGNINNGRAYYTRNDLVINGVPFDKVRSYYVAEGSYFKQFADNFNNDPKPVAFIDSEFYKKEVHDRDSLNNPNTFDGFGFFTVKDDGATIDEYTIITQNAIYYSKDGGKTWIEK